MGYPNGILKRMKKALAKKLLNFLIDGVLEVNEIKIGGKTIKIDANSITFHPLTSNPTLESGKTWFRSDIPAMLYSPDGINIRKIHPPDWNDVVNKPSSFPPSSHASSHASGGSDPIPEGGIARSQLEYPTENVNLGYLLAIGKAQFRVRANNLEQVGLFTVDTFNDKAIKAFLHDQGHFFARQSNDDNSMYIAHINTTYPTMDFGIRKQVNGSETILGYEAIDLQDIAYLCKFSLNGSILKAYRDDMTTPKITATDTSLTSGFFGCGTADQLRHNVNAYFGELLPPGSLATKPIAYFETPIVGSGTAEDPFRPQIPEEIVEHPVYGRTNQLSLSFSALIPTDSATGKPIHSTAIVRVFEQPNRQTHLYPIEKCLDALRDMRGVRELNRGEAIALAQKIDDKLHLHDLISIPKPDKTQIKEYIDWRMSTHKVEMDVKNAERYIQEDKGW